MYVENLPREITEKIPAPESLLQQSGRSKASNFIKKKTPAQAPSRESRETPKTYPTLEHLRWLPPKRYWEEGL